MDALTTINTRTTPQSEQASPGQVRNSAGGYTFQVDALTRLRRFLTLGVDGGTYYVGGVACVHHGGLQVRIVVHFAVPDAGD